jgi:hypothetical protein
MQDGYDAASAALSGKTKPGKMRVEEIRMRRGHKGGFIAKHHLKDEKGMQHAEHEYPLADKKAMLAHMDEHLGDNEAAEGESPDNQPDGVK